MSPNRPSARRLAASRLALLIAWDVAVFAVVVVLLLARVQPAIVALVLVVLVGLALLTWPRRG
ncbi:MAG TPA: hypothetical protein VFF43_16370 [Caldimonas sp.]|nr:hypothetical protein [Caldimonas sp.]